MNKSLLIILASLLFASTVFAQQRQRGRQGYEQVEAEKIAFFTRTLELTSREAREFWPVYDDFQDRRNALIREKHILSRSFAENYDNMTANEAGKIADQYINLQVKETDLAVEFHEKFKNVLPPAKVMRFYQAENEFRMQLLRRIRGGGRGQAGSDRM
ncbi:MAG: hypothetical protein ACFCUM_19895 [Bacteroidales bacterium]